MQQAAATAANRPRRGFDHGSERPARPRGHVHSAGKSERGGSTRRRQAAWNAVASCRWWLAASAPYVQLRKQPGGA
jgi:hypothetical protein